MARLGRGLQRGDRRHHLSLARRHGNVFRFFLFRGRDFGRLGLLFALVLGKGCRRNFLRLALAPGDIEISATDWMASPEFEPIQGNTFAIFVVGKSYDDIKTVFNKLKDGDNNKRLQELHDMPFGTYGQFYDKYGIQWIFKGDKKE